VIGLDRFESSHVIDIAYRCPSIRRCLSMYMIITTLSFITIADGLFRQDLVQ